MNISHRAVIFACFRNSMSPTRTLHFLRNAFGNGCPCKSTVFRWYARFREGSSSLLDDSRSGRPPIPRLQMSIRRLLKRNRFSSTRSLSRHLSISHMTIYKTLKSTMKMKRLKLRVIPHTLNNSIRSKRVKYSKELLQQLHELKPIDVITCDESWFYFNNHGNSMWVKEKNELPIIEKRGIDSKKVMISIFWNFYNLVHIQCVPEGDVVDTDYIVFTLFPELYDIALKHRPSQGLKSFALHWDNAKPHRSRDTSAAVEELFRCSLAHPPYSPDLAPSDFFLFGHLKRLLQGKIITNVSHLKMELEHAFKTINTEMKKGVFNEWIRRLEETVESGGEYINTI